PVAMDVGVDETLGCLAARALAERGKTPLPEDLLCLVQVPVGVLQGLLAVHHPRPGDVPKPLHHLCGDRSGLGHPAPPASSAEPPVASVGRSAPLAASFVSFVSSASSAATASA